MTILDTSLLIPLFRSKAPDYASRLAEEIGELDLFLSSVTQMELLQGSGDEREWQRIEVFLRTQDILEPPPLVWELAARTYFDLRRNGRTPRSVLDCIIAETAIARNMTLLHNDRDFEAIALVRPLQQRRIEIQ